MGLETDYVLFVPLCGKPDDPELNPIAVSLLTRTKTSFLLEV